GVVGVVGLLRLLGLGGCDGVTTGTSAAAAGRERRRALARCDVALLAVIDRRIGVGTVVGFGLGEPVVRVLERPADVGRKVRRIGIVVVPRQQVAGGALDERFIGRFAGSEGDVGQGVIHLALAGFDEGGKRTG